MTFPASTPLMFTPYLRPQPWGDQRFARCLQRTLPTAGRFGESWELSAHALHDSCVADGPETGQTLSQLWREHRGHWWGADAPAAFPWLVKFLDCHEFLSVQVHPSDELARENSSGEGGKTEAWVVLDADPTARIYAGFKSGVTRGEVTERMAEGTLADCLHSFVPRPGDCVFIPAGTVHAVGGGVLMVEVQQSSDVTYRLFDWNRVGLDGRPRPLHHRESLSAIDWAVGPVQPVKPTPLIGDDELVGESLVSCPYFDWKRYRLGETSATWLPKALSVFSLVEGEAILTGDGFERRVCLGDTLLVPTSPFPQTWTPLAPTTLLRVDPADVPANGVRPAEVGRVRSIVG
jgi:mannose-6-phosphate isomerase